MITERMICRSLYLGEDICWGHAENAWDCHLSKWGATGLL